MHISIWCNDRVAISGTTISLDKIAYTDIALFFAP